VRHVLDVSVRLLAGADSLCQNAADDDESSNPPAVGVGCGLGPELAPLLALLGALRWRRRRS
jgi:hypothetical protein